MRDFKRKPHLNPSAKWRRGLGTPPKFLLLFSQLRGLFSPSPPFGGKGWDGAFFLLIFSLFVFSGCKKEIIENTVYDNVIFDLDTVPVYSSNAEKTKQKINDQYISILYSDLFNKTISSNELLDLGELSLAVGDKQMLSQLVISGFMKEPGVALPTNVQMRNDIDKFITDTYIRFYLRLPSEYERYFLKDLIQNDQGMTPELIYTSFALSNEYFFY